MTGSERVLKLVPLGWFVRTQDDVGRGSLACAKPPMSPTGCSARHASVGSAVTKVRTTRSGGLLSGDYSTSLNPRDPRCSTKGAREKRGSRTTMGGLGRVVGYVLSLSFHDGEPFAFPDIFRLLVHGVRLVVAFAS
jgi:hypothetical protein